MPHYEPSSWYPQLFQFVQNSHWSVESWGHHFRVEGGSQGTADVEGRGEEGWELDGET